jgi:hypothetical protein
MILLNKKYSFILAFPAISSLIFCTPPPMRYCNDSTHELANSGLIALCAPFKTLHVEYEDNTRLKPTVQYSDSFLLEAASSLLLFEATQKFKMLPSQRGGRNPVDTMASSAYSVLTHDTTLFSETSKRIRELAARCSVDIVILPYSCFIIQQVRQPKGWRNCNGPGYGRPSAFSAKTNVHIQVWNKNGQLLFERIGRSDTGKPILYSLLKKENPGDDIVLFAKKIYAPPLIRSLSASIKNALRFN